MAPASAPADARGALTVAPPPLDLRQAVTGFIRRIDPDCGGVVRILPDVRISLQVQAADPYWIGEQEAGRDWRIVPRVSLWGPRHTWGWGYAQRDISAFAVSLTTAGAAALIRAPTSTLVNETLPVADLEPALSVALDARPDEEFDAWIARATQALREAFRNRPLARDPVAESLPILAVADGDVTAQAAAACGLSERHYRRVFRQFHGASPKLYQRLLRVDRKLRELHARPWETDPWEDVPIPFADQPHLIREFQALTGMTPRAYARAKAAGDATLRSVSHLPTAPSPPAA